MIAVVLSVAFAAEVDRAPSGAIVTVRPEQGERACVLDRQGAPLALCSEISAEYSQPFWLVHPDAWRNAVASVTEMQTKLGTVDELQKINADLELRIASVTEQSNLSKTDLIRCQEGRRADKRAHVRELFIATATTAVLTAGTVTTAFLLL